MSKRGEEYSDFGHVFIPKSSTIEGTAANRVICSEGGLELGFILAIDL